MANSIRRGVALICSLIFLTTASAGVQEILLDVSLKQGNDKAPDKRYQLTMGKETVIEGSALYRIVVTPTSISSDSVSLSFRVLEAGTNVLNSGGTTIFKLGRKATMLIQGYPDSPQRLVIEAAPFLK